MVMASVSQRRKLPGHIQQMHLKMLCKIMWTPEELEPASERPKDAARHILGFSKVFSSQHAGS